MRFFLISCFLTLISFSVYSQGFRGGISGGLTATQVDGDKYGGYRKVGVQGGVYSKYYFDDKAALSFKLRYMPKGSYQNDEKQHYFFKISLHYIELPVTFSYRIYEKLDVNAGLSLGWLLKYKVEDSSGQVANNRLSYKKTDINVFGGISYYLTEHISVGLQYAYSLLPINTKLRPQYNNMLIATANYEF